MNRRRARNGIAPGPPAGGDGEDCGEAWRQTGTGAVVTCRLTPRGGRDAIAGVETRGDGTRVLAVRVRAPPEEGRANDALRALVADALGVAVSRVALVAGTRNRVKRVAISGDGRALIDRLRELPTLSPAIGKDS
jgi:hypothetical protein